MSLLNFEPSSPLRNGSKKPFKLILGIGALIGTVLLGSTLAASINLNSGGPVEFGQGVTQTTACDNGVEVTPISSFVNSDGGGDFKFSAITLSDLDGTDQAESSPGCAGKTFTIKSYDSYGIQLQPSYEISVDSDGNFSSLSGNTNANGEGTTDSSVTLTFFGGILTSAESVYRITIETGKTEVTLIFQGPLTGLDAELGLAQLAAARFAVSRFNSQNDNYFVKLVLIDDQGDGSVAPGVVSQMLEEHPEVIGVIGPGFSGTSVTSAPLYRTAGIVMVATTASRPSLTDPNSENYGAPVFHRMISTEVAQGTEIADYAVDGISNPQVYIVDAYPTAILHIRNSIIERLDPSLIVGNQTLESGIQDFSAIAAQVRSTDPNSVIFLGYAEDAARFVVSLRNTGYTGVITLGDMRGDPSFLVMAGVNSEGARFVSTLPNVSDVATQLFSEFNVFPGTSDSFGAAQTIDATNIFLQGIASGNLNRSSMLSWVDSYSGVGIGGDPISFDQHGDRNGIGSIARFVVSNGSYVYVPW